MGKRGPPRKPTAQKKIQGTYRKDRAPKREVTSDPGTPPCPDYLDEHALEFWNYYSPLLVKRGLLTPLDWAEFVSLCQAWSRKRQCEIILAEKGLTIEYASGHVQQRAEISIQNQADALIARLAPRFGLDPSARSSMDVPGPAGKQDPDEAFLFGGGGPKLVKDDLGEKKKRGRASA